MTNIKLNTKGHYIVPAYGHKNHIANAKAYGRLIDAHKTRVTLCIQSGMSFAEAMAKLVSDYACGKVTKG